MTPMHCDRCACERGVSDHAEPYWSMGAWYLCSACADALDPPEDEFDAGGAWRWAAAEARA